MKFFKYASRAWAKQVAKGMLSSHSLDRLGKEMPGVTGGLSRTPLGIGGQGKVYPTYTTGIGETAAKVFNQADNPVNVATTDFLLEATKNGDPAFAKVYKKLRNGKGHIMERLTPAKKPTLKEGFDFFRRYKNSTRWSWANLVGVQKHTSGAYLGDVKPANVMRNSEGKLVVSDPIVLKGRNPFKWRRQVMSTV